MRDTLIAYIKGINLYTFTVSEEYPRNESGTALYLKNQKTIYVDGENYEQEPLIQTLNSLQVHSSTVSVTIYFSVDGKRVPNNYQRLVDLLLMGKNLGHELNYHSTTVNLSTSYEQDLLITEIEYNFTNVN